ncbi:MAG: addiction module toxin RelE [Hydrocarboniphaga sp.]|uniref:type II toxin-antitoxin system RelE family toxin n=1 Tax=Hydrocarboniphaga sp. TaxID=2033016 RepID=UPI002617D909|nr:type II toxin-antitoxin system RelE/ParE family toxin [Hydrocarboniphaga sp.]MDB5971949.1 addiction module toxin RelE [Hydrocarboniphaga sp.]
MAWTIEYSNEARKALKRMPANISSLIEAKLTLLSQNPYAPNNNVKKLQGRAAYRLRIGDWRAIYELQDEIITIYIVTVAPRGGAYP